MSKQFAIFLTFLFVAHCESFAVDTLPKCSIKDNECQKNSFQNMIKNIGKTGIPELNIPPIDPIVIKDESVSVLNLLNITLIDGYVKGIKDCVFDKYEIDIEKGTAFQAITCDLLIKGHYSVFADNPAIRDLLGKGGIKGDGNGKVKIEKLYMTLDIPFYPVKKDDGEIYLKCLYEKTDYTYDIKGKASFAADNIFLGEENVSELVIKYLNDNWKFLMRTFGKSFVDKAMYYYFDFAKKFFEGVPARHYVIEDLTPYIKQ